METAEYIEVVYINEAYFSVTQINSYIHRIFESDYALKKIYLKEKFQTVSIIRPGIFILL